MSEEKSKKDKADEEKAERFRRKWVNRTLARSCHPEKAKTAFVNAYRAAFADTPEKKKTYKDPEVVYCTSPRAMYRWLLDDYKGNEAWAKEDFAISDGAFWCDWRAMYDHFYADGGMPEKIAAYIEIDKTGVFMWALYEDLVLFCPPPKVQHYRQRQAETDPLVLHCENGPAFEWEDGCKLYRINGVSVPDWLVETRAEELDPKRFAEIENAEVRREFIRKVGMERILAHVPHKTLDEKDEYSLLSVDVGTGGERIYLKMRNPSLGVWHMEAVAPDCKTVQEAINWRMNGDKTQTWTPEQLT